MKQKSNLKWLVVAVVLLLALVFTLLYLNRKAVNEKKMFETQSQAIQTQYDDLMGKYEKLYQENTEYVKQLGEKDSILHANAAEIQRLLVKARNADNYNALKRKYNDLEQEYNGLKRAVDSLKVENDRLNEENQQIKEDLIEEKTLKNQLQDENTQLSEKVNLARILSARDIVSSPLKLKTCKKKYIETNRANKLNRLKITMQLDENRVANPGSRTVYVQVYTPNNKILINEGESATFDVAGVSKEYTTKLDFDYSGNTRDLTLLWNKKGEAPLLKGFYRVSVYCEGYEIGKSRFELK